MSWLIETNINDLVLTFALITYIILLTKQFLLYIAESKDNSINKTYQIGPVEIFVVILIFSMIAWAMKDTSRKKQIKNATLLQNDNPSKAVDIFIGIKDWERAAEIIVKAPQGTQILLLRRLSSYIPQSMLKNIFLRIGDKYRNSQFSDLSAGAYQLADMPWRAAQAYISSGNDQAALEVINTSQVFSKDRNKAVRNLAKFAFDTYKPLEAARLLQSIGAEEEAMAVLVATGREGSTLNKDNVQNKPDIPSRNSAIEKKSLSDNNSGQHVQRASPIAMLQKEISSAKSEILSGNIKEAEKILNTSQPLIDKIPVKNSTEALNLRKNFVKSSEAIKRLIDARESFKSRKIEKSQILYSELLEYAGDLFNSEVFAEAGLSYEHDPSDFEIARDYFLEASKKAKTDQAKKNYNARAEKALQNLEHIIPGVAADTTDGSKNIGKMIKITTTESCCVCKRGVSGEVMQCNQCKSVAHYPHIAEWLKIKGVCPVCKQKLVVPESKKVALTN